MLLACVGLIATGSAGCVPGVTQTTGWTSLELHGKAGYSLAWVGRAVGQPINVVCLPLTYPIALRNESAFPWRSESANTAVMRRPGAAIEWTFYYVGAACAYPVHVGGVALPRAIWLGLASDSSTITYLLDRMPFISEGEYRRLVAASGRANYLPYAPFPDAVFGMKPRAPDQVAAEWRWWDEEGRPAGEGLEREYMLRHWKAGREGDLHRTHPPPPR
jgi:hypothetical protein